MPASDYNFIRQLGAGTYGQVYQAQHVATKDTVAIKVVRLRGEGVPAELIKEISILKEMKHDKIVKLYDVLHEERAVKLVMELLGTDLGQYLTRPESAVKGVVHPQVCRSLMHQLLQGMQHLHSHGVMHRDLKPQNILVSFQGTLKIADFGLSRVDIDASATELGDSAIKLNHKVVTLWYRAPEALMSSSSGTFYDFSLDVWSIGCIMAEMMLGRPLFSGSKESQTLLEQFKLLGLPSRAQRRRVEARFKSMRNYSWPNYKPQDWNSIFAPWTQLSQELLRSMLQLEPEARVTCESALTHDYIITGPLIGNPNAKGKYTLQEKEQLAAIAQVKVRPLQTAVQPLLSTSQNPSVTKF